MSAADIPLLVDYWAGASPELLAAMGVDGARLAPAAEMAEGLAKLLGVPDESANVAYLVWKEDGRGVGFSSLKNIRFGESGEMHLHLAEAGRRQRGLCGIFFCLSALEFYRRFRLARVKCEPRAENPAPNRMLQKVGFRLVGSRVGASSELSLVTELNEYEITESVAREFLARQGGVS